MNKQEYAHWQKVTAMSETQWVFDTIMFHNHGDMLWYKGGENGAYVWAENNGTVTIGNYEGAIPCITDALFKPVYSKGFENGIKDAAKYALEKLGLEGLYALAI